MDRLDLHTLLTAIVDNVYFQPPDTINMTYPCIIYKRDYQQTRFADDYPYSRTKRYLITYVDRDPDSGNFDKIAELPLCVFDRHFTADNLNHDVFKLFF